jgi:hypothetical protein
VFKDREILDKLDELRKILIRLSHDLQQVKVRTNTVKKATKKVK